MFYYCVFFLLCFHFVQSDASNSWFCILIYLLSFHWIFFAYQNYFPYRLVLDYCSVVMNSLWSLIAFFLFACCFFLLVFLVNSFCPFKKETKVLYMIYCFRLTLSAIYSLIIMQWWWMSSSVAFFLLISTAFVRLIFVHLLVWFYN